VPSLSSTPVAPTGAANFLLRVTPVVFVLIWSTGFVVAKFGLPFAPPLTFLALRYFFSIVCFLLWIGIARAKWPRGRAQWIHLGVTGMLMHGGYLGGVWVAVKGGMGSGLAALIVGLQPVLTALWVSWMASRDVTGNQQKVTLQQWGGLGLGLGGLLLVVSGKFGAGHEVTALTLSAAVIALLSITAGTLYQKRYVEPADVRTANAVQLMAALLLTLPLTLLESEAISWNPHFIGAMAWSVLALTLGGSSLLYLLIQRGATTAVTSLLYLVPPTTALMAWILFDELITVATVSGTVLTAMGVALVVRSPAPKNKVTRQDV
jgi:drug/metabolite transporter (DMT)-like permease